jgi:hypothetical protein
MHIVGCTIGIYKCEFALKRSSWKYRRPNVIGLYIFIHNTYLDAYICVHKFNDSVFLSLFCVECINLAQFLQASLIHYSAFLYLSHSILYQQGGSHIYNDSLENVVKGSEKDNPQSNKIGFLRKLFWILFH